MIETPFRYDPMLPSEDFTKLGQLMLRWSHTEHIIGNCLRVVLGLSLEQAAVVVFPLGADRRISHLTDLALIRPFNAEATAALSALKPTMKALQIVRSSIAHGVIADPDDANISFYLRSAGRTLTLQQIFSTEELTNYAAHAAVSLRYALGIKEGPDAWHALPDRPPIPEFLQSFFPTPKNQKKAKHQSQPQS